MRALASPLFLTSPVVAVVKKVLFHRYDNEPDIKEVEVRGYSDVYQRSSHDDFDLVVVLPTGAAKTEIAVVADAASKQYDPEGGPDWPGRPDSYRIRVDVENVRYTTRSQVREALLKVDAWLGQWTVRVASLEEDTLFERKQSISAETPKSYTVSDPTDLKETESYPEGTVRKVLVNAVERNRAARKKCIDYFGAVCYVCEFDFEAEYGKAAEGYIHVHHLKSLAETQGQYEVDPINDLRPVCPNCHAVIHLRTPPFTMEEMRSLVLSHKPVPRSQPTQPTRERKQRRLPDEIVVARPPSRSHNQAA